MKSTVIIIALAAAVAGPVTAHAQQATCGDSTQVMRGDTLSSIAERCGITEGALMQANPSIDGSGDLRVGTAIRTTSLTNRAGNKLRKFAHGVSSGISRLASEVGSSVDDLLDKNPDLKQRLGSIGDKLNGEAGGSRSMKLTVSPLQGPTGSTVDLVASGLPANAALVIGAGRPGRSYTVLERTKAGADGALSVKLDVPQWANKDRDLVFVVAADDSDWTIRSTKFDVR